jgi:transcriptional regulator with XRE-family HTH domain
MPTVLHPTATLGERVRYYRDRAGRTQDGLAAVAGISTAHVRAIERGLRMPSSAVVNSLARAFGVHPNELTGQPYLAELDGDGLHPLIQPIRYAIDTWDLPDTSRPPRPAAAIAAAADRILALVRATDLKSAAGELPGLIEEATTAAHQRGDWATLASLYRSAYDVATKLGFPDLAALSLERMGWAAEHASDAAVVAVRQYMRALVHHRAGDYQLGQRLVADGQRILDQADPGHTTDVVRGQLHLGGAVLAARAQDEESAAYHLRESERIAQGTGEAARVLWLSYGPTNVGLHTVAVYSELGQYSKAVLAGDAVRMPDGWPPSRAAGFHLDMARARLLTGDAEGSLRDLLTARLTAPQQTRYSPVARETARHLLTLERSRAGTITHMATWLGVA